jgi:glucose/arabinose dehydrogenase
LNASVLQVNAAPILEPLFQNLNFPVAFTFSSDGRLFFNEKNTGNIRVIQNGVIQPSPFATLTIVNNGEQGLLGISLDPNFATNEFLYVYYTYSDGSLYHGRITRLIASGNTGTSPLNIFDVTDTSPGSTNHNGGYLEFGPDGKLYAEVGEFANPPSSQELGTNAGKILRMNPDGTVPSDNPFGGSLVYAYGVRNAFGMEFDPNTDMLIETEAGPSTDEINIITAGANYGWPTCTGVCNNPAYVDPIITFTPATTPTGIAYGSPNTFCFGEWNTGELKRLELTPDGKAAQSVSQALTLNTPGNGIVAVERAPDNSIYFSTSTAIFRYTPDRNTTRTTQDVPEFSTKQILMIGTAAVAFALALSWLLFRRMNDNRRSR